MWGNKSSAIATANINSGGSSMHMSNIDVTRNPSGPMTITVDGKNLSSNIVSPKLNGTYTSKTCADCTCHVWFSEESITNKRNIVLIETNCYTILRDEA